MGATSFAYDLARRFGLKIVEPRPALVPLTLAGDDALFRPCPGSPPCGRAAPARASVPRSRPVHPSRPVRAGDPAGVVLLAARRADRDRLPARPRRRLAAPRPSAPTRAARFGQLLDAALPERLAETLADQTRARWRPRRLPDRTLDAAERRLRGWRFTPNGSEGFAKAEVTIGGISTAELSSQTMEAKRLPGLFAIGEAVDVTGWLGGYNFQWAWASAHAAAQAL